MTSFTYKFLFLTTIITFLITTSHCLLANASFVIKGAKIVDGSGASARLGSVRIKGEFIQEVGDNITPLSGEKIIDGKGLVLAPGFIDSHSHHDENCDKFSDMFAPLNQGITTIVVGQDGQSQFPLKNFWKKREEKPISVNIATFTGFGSLRTAVMGKDYKRHASPSEISQMKELLIQDMKEGSLGLSTGLEYDPDTYASTEEIISLAKVASQLGGRYISHIRSEDRKFWEAIEEIIDIGKKAQIPVHISHLKLAMKSLWNKTDQLFDRLNKARQEGIAISADAYPYTYWQSSLTVLFPNRDFSNEKTAQAVLKEIVPADGILLTMYKPNPKFSGKTLAEIAKLQKQSPEKTLMELIDKSEKLKAKKGKETETIIGYSIDEDDIKQIFKWPHTNFCSDGYLQDTHPRGIGSFPRILGRYVREWKVMNLETAIHRMSELSARHMGITNRGLIRPNYYADLVLFREETIIDHATAQNPLLPSEGIAKVYVNGQLVYEDGKTTLARPGKILRAARSQSVF